MEMQKVIFKEHTFNFIWKEAHSELLVENSNIEKTRFSEFYTDSIYNPDNLQGLKNWKKP